MERPKRRFIPEGISPTESLEDRLCMSASQFSGSMQGLGQGQARSSNVAGFGSTQNPWSIRREARIERVPASFYEIDPTQIIPRDVTASIQANLQQLLGTIPGKTQPNLRTAMNQLLRGMVPYQNVSAQGAAAINNTFGKLLLSAGANPTIVANLQADMTQVTQAAISTSTQPSFAVTNNYVYMYFAATTVGWSIPTPDAPKLAPAMNKNPNGDPVTMSRRPQFMGVYPPNMLIEILDVSNGNVIARGSSQGNGRYTASSRVTLNPGVYTLTTRASTPGGETSQFSAWTTLTVISGPTRGR
jgi:hypothetical protein